MSASDRSVRTFKKSKIELSLLKLYAFSRSSKDRKRKKLNLGLLKYDSFLSINQNPVLGMVINRLG